MRKIYGKICYKWRWSTLKRNQLIFFSFFPNIDYNSKIIKFSFFFFTFSLSYTVNAFFFNDSTMHKIYTDKGEYDFIYRLPEIIISTLVTQVINISVKKLSLSEGSIIYIKSIKYMDLTIKEAKKTYTCLKIRFLIFFIFSYLLLGFFWYYLGCFCAVYKNTQVYLMKDTIFSFSLSLLYPFGIYLIPTIFRIMALRDPKHKKSCIYGITKLF